MIKPNPDRLLRPALWLWVVLMLMMVVSPLGDEFKPAVTIAGVHFNLQGDALDIYTHEVPFIWGIRADDPIGGATVFRRPFYIYRVDRFADGSTKWTLILSLVVPQFASTVLLVCLVGRRIARATRRRAAMRSGRCVACDYDLRGTPGPTCPECGEPFAGMKPLTSSDRAGGSDTPET